MTIKRVALAAGLLAASTALAGCADGYGRYNRYGYGYGYNTGYYGQGYGRGYSPSWYDGYYGNIYDGYWDRGGYFYYRVDRRDGWRRDDGRHFRRGDHPGRGWNQWHGRGGRHHDRDHDGD